MSVIAIVGGPQSIGPASGGKVYAYNNLSTTPAVVAPANPSRRQITFHNPGDVDVFVAPSLQYSSGAASTLTPTTSALGGCFRIFANGGTLVLSGECQGAWQAFSASSTNKPLTVMDTNT